jgi:hypothetical protein
MILRPLWIHIFGESSEYKKYGLKDFALVCIDIYSRYVWAVAMDSEDAASTAAVMLKIFYHMGKPDALQGDTKIIDAFKKELSPYFPDVVLMASKPHETNKNAIVERAIRTIKNDLLKFLYIHGFPKKEITDITTGILQEVCTLRNNTFHRITLQKPIDVFYGRELNQQIPTKKKYPQFNQLDLVIAKPLRSRGALGIKIFRFDYDIYIILLKDGNKYKLKSLYNFIHEINTVKKRWYKPYELRKITPQQAFKHLNSPLVQEYLYQVYKTRDAVEDMKKYIQQQF